jgi:hypothetical protein
MALAEEGQPMEEEAELDDGFSRSRDYWKMSFRDLRHNFVVAWPIFGSLAFYLLIASVILNYAENVRNYGVATYETWMSMTTIGGATVTTSLGRSIVSLDALVGIVMFGAVIWVVTRSLQARVDPYHR